MDAKTKALQVLVLTRHIRAYLAKHDPKALEQAIAALGIELPVEPPEGELRFELEQLMGGGKWEAVWETKEQADYESPDHLSFETEGEAHFYAQKHWSHPSYVRVVAVRSIRTIEEG